MSIWIRLEKATLEKGKIYEVMDWNKFVGQAEYIGGETFKTLRGYEFRGAAIRKQ